MEPIVTPGIMTADVSARETVNEDFDAIIRLHWGRVFRFAMASLRDRDAAECVAQDCFIRAFRARNAFRGESSIQTWLMKIAVNLVRDRQRSRKLQFWKRASHDAVQVDLAGLPAARHLSPEEQTVLHDQLRAVWEATALLPERQRSVFLLRFVEDMDLLEISRAMGLSEGAVKKHLFRAVHTVRERIGGTR